MQLKFYMAEVISAIENLHGKFSLEKSDFVKDKI